MTETVVTEITRTRFVFTALAVGAAAYALLQLLVAPAIPEIRRELHASTTGIAWIFTAYLLSASVATPIIARLGDVAGKRRALLLALGGLAGGSLLAALTTSLPLLIAARVIQGVGGAVFPLAFAILRDQFSPRRATTAIAMMSAITGIGAGAGIVLAGPITTHLSYHWLFWIPFIAVALAACLAVVAIPESPRQSGQGLGWWSGALLSGWLVCLLLALSEAPSWGWGSLRTAALFAASPVLAAVWIRHELRSDRPLIDLVVMRLRAVWTTNVATLLLGFASFGLFVVVPELVETPTRTGYGLDASVTGAGVVLLPATVAMLIAGPIAGRLALRSSGLHSSGARFYACWRSSCSQSFITSIGSCTSQRPY